MEEVIYVIYFDGKRFESHNRRIAYLSESPAKQVVTVEAKHKAIYEYEGDSRDLSRKTNFYFDELPKEVQKELINKMRERFEIVHYTPKIER